MSFSPPRAEPLSIAGPAGALEALLEDPASVRPTGVAVVCHPHPQHGGTMHNKVVHTLARTCQERGMPSVRFNYRGVGASTGAYDEARGETEDTLAVMAWARARWPQLPLTLAGFSFGALVSLRAAQSQMPRRLISVAPAVAHVAYEGVARPACPWLVIQGDADEVVDWRQVQAFAQGFVPAPELVLLSGAGHFFHGRLDDLRASVGAFIDRDP